MVMKKKNLFKKAIKNLILKLPHLANWHYPRYMVIESSNMCNLRCPLCAVGRGLSRPSGLMSLDLFKKILSQINWDIKMLNFAFAGEPLLNKEIFKMVELASERGYKSKIETNGMLLDNYISDIFMSRLQYINIALDGSNQDMLNKYRIGADFNKIISGINRLCSKRKSIRSQLPQITIQVLMMKHNQAYIDDIIRLARDLGVDTVRIKSLNLNMGLDLSRQDKLFLADRFLPDDKEYRRYEGKKNKINFRHNLYPFCEYPLSSQVILWNGDVVLCCLDFNANFVIGNIKDNSLKEIWESYLVRKWRSQAIRRSLPLCKNCSYAGSLINEIIFDNKH